MDKTPEKKDSAQSSQMDKTTEKKDSAQSSQMDKTPEKKDSAQSSQPPGHVAAPSEETMIAEITQVFGGLDVVLGTQPEIPEQNDGHQQSQVNEDDDAIFTPSAAGSPRSPFSMNDLLNSPASPSMNQNPLSEAPVEEVSAQEPLPETAVEGAVEDSSKGPLLESEPVAVAASSGSAVNSSDAIEQPVAGAAASGSAVSSSDPIEQPVEGAASSGSAVNSSDAIEQQEPSSSSRPATEVPEAEVPAAEVPEAEVPEATPKSAGVVRGPKVFSSPAALQSISPPGCSIRLNRSLVKCVLGVFVFCLQVSFFFWLLLWELIPTSIVSKYNMFKLEVVTFGDE